MQPRFLALLSGLRIWHCCELWWAGRRHGSDPALLWLWRRAAATAPIRPLAWEPPYALGVALEKAKGQKKKKKKRRQEPILATPTQFLLTKDLIDGTHK